MELIREMSCCFTGHRRLSDETLLWLRPRLREEIDSLARQGVELFLAGGALGFDTAAAQEVLRVKGERYPVIRLVLVLPCLEQSSRWSRQDAAVYQEVLRSADEVIYTGDLYTRGCMFRRNRYLVDHSAYCLCYLNGEEGGTAYTVRYAQRQGLTVRNLALEQEEG